jgi:hypothetical protein
MHEKKGGKSIPIFHFIDIDFWWKKKIGGERPERKFIEDSNPLRSQSF